MEYLVIWGEQRKNPITYVHERYSRVHDHKRFCVLLQLADIDIKQIAQGDEIKYVLHTYVDSGYDRLSGIKGFKDVYNCAFLNTLHPTQNIPKHGSVLFCLPAIFFIFPKMDGGREGKMQVLNPAIFSGERGCILMVSETYIQRRVARHVRTHEPLGYCSRFPNFFFFALSNSIV